MFRRCLETKNREMLGSLAWKCLVIIVDTSMQVLVRKQHFRAIFYIFLWARTPNAKPQTFGFVSSGKMGTVHFCKKNSETTLPYMFCPMRKMYYTRLIFRLLPVKNFVVVNDQCGWGTIWTFMKLVVKRRSLYLHPGGCA